MTQPITKLIKGYDMFTSPFGTNLGSNNNIYSGINANKFAFGPRNFSGQSGPISPFAQQNANAFALPEEMAMGGQKSPFGNIGLDQIGAGIGIGKDLYGMYMANQGMKLGKEQFNLNKQAYYDNVANRNRVVNASKRAFA
jgi:hypothetical protein